MANRSIQAKILKSKRRGRFARFSGATSKVKQKAVLVLEHIDDDKVKVKQVEVYVGLVSLSKQVPKGSGPNAERMNSYYERLRSPVETQTLADVLGLVKDERYAHVWWETPSINRVNLVDGVNGRLDLYFYGTRWFFVDLDFQKKIIKRSRDHGSKMMAMMKLTTKTIQWVDSIPM